MKTNPKIPTNSSTMITIAFIAAIFTIVLSAQQTCLARGPAVEQVTGGGVTISERWSGTVLQWTSLSVHRDSAGVVSGMIEYANLGIQDWRYQLEPECLHISEDGTRAVIIGAVVLSEGPEAPPLGTRVIFFVKDFGNGGGSDGLAIFWALDIFSCDSPRWYLEYLFNFTDPVDGNFSIRRR